MVRNHDRWLYRSIGIAVWLSLVILVTTVGASLANRRFSSFATGQLLDYWFARETIIQRVAVKNLVMTGDAVFYRGDNAQWTQVGFVESISSVPGSDRRPNDPSQNGHDVLVTLRWHSATVDPQRLRLVGYRNLGTMNEMAEVLFPPEKRELIRQEITEAMRQHGDLLAEQFLPLVERSVRQSIPVVEAELMAALDRHRDELNELSLRWKDQWLDSRLVPLAKSRVLPIAQEHTEPLVREIGRELWNRASLWSFTWRAVYDKTPLPRKDLMREEWDRFVREEAIPVIESHSDDIATAIQRTLADVARNPNIRSELGSAVNALVDDPQTRRLIGTLLRETLVENPKIRQVWIDVWTSDEAKAALDRAGNLVEPLVRKLGDEIIGSPERGIDPGFARVLRHQILGKDRRWIVAQSVPNERYDKNHDVSRIEIGRGDAIYPLLPTMDLQSSE